MTEPSKEFTFIKHYRNWRISSYELSQDALQILQNWCSKTGYLWGGGVGVGSGGGLAQMPKTESGHGPREPIDHALSLLAKKFLYKIAAQFGWRQLIRANGGRVKDLGKKL